MGPAQLAAVSYLARYSGHTHLLYAYQLRRWFGWCESNGLDPLLRIQRAHVELYIRHLGASGLMPSSVNTSIHAVRGCFRFALTMTWRQGALDGPRLSESCQRAERPTPIAS